jgi:hypothetical protein
MLAVAFGVMFWRAERELKKPRLLVQEDFRPDGQRGLGAPSNDLTAAGDFFFVPSVGEASYESYRAQIIDFGTPPRTVWTSEPVAPRNGAAVVVALSRRSLKPGKYKLLVYGINGARQDELSSYTLRIPAR